jgi:hypothetical protein
MSTFSLAGQRLDPEAMTLLPLGVFEPASVPRRVFANMRIRSPPVVKQMPEHEMARVGTQRDEVFGVKFEFGPISIGHDVVHFEVSAAAAGDALGLPGQMLAADSRPRPGAAILVVSISPQPRKQRHAAHA